jgi:hypothetical protein
MSDEPKKKKDLTNLHELSEFIHEEDPALNKLLDTHTDLKGRQDPSDDDDSDVEELLGSNTDPEIVLNEEETPQEFSDLNISDDDSSEDNFSSESNELGSAQDESTSLEQEFSTSDFDSLDGPPLFEESENFQDSSTPPFFNEDPLEEVQESKNQILPAEEQLAKSIPTSKKLSEISTPAPRVERQIELSKNSVPTQTKKEFIQDIQHFMNQYDIGVIKREGNPPFTLLIEEVKTTNQKNEIKKILRDYKIVPEQEFAEYEKQLDYECLLLTHLSEYSAIFLAEKIRKLKVRLKVGLSGNIRESEHYERDDFGTIGPKQLDQNRESSKNFKEVDLKEWVLISNHMSVPDYEIVEYLGIGQQSYYFDKKDLLRLKGQSTDHIQTAEYLTNFFNEHIDQDYLNFKLRFKNELNQIFEGLVTRLRENAEQKGANALLGTQFQIHQLSGKDEAYMMNTTATLVKLKKK